MVHVYTGDGKGKTTASIGIAFRALGHGLHVYMIQFMKGDKNYGEISAASYLDRSTFGTRPKIGDFEIAQFGRRGFVDRGNPDEKDVELAKNGIEHAKEVIESDEYDIVILDEINVALDFGLIKTKEVMDLIKNKPPRVELILTGRYVPKEIIEIGDYVTEMVEIKHPYPREAARHGIEY
jgi:cob(I)alamin adenosyltransferase